jgi:CRP/FNR family nitrogen fixation transcriptional regulator
MRAPNVRKSEIVKRIERRRLPADPAPQRDVLIRRMLSMSMKFGARTEIYGEGEPVEYIYEVMNGAVRTAQVLPDGRRMVGGFFFTGDIVGLGDGAEHSMSAEAIVPSTVRAIKRQPLIRMADDEQEIAEWLLTATMRETARVNHHALMLSMTAQERVSRFLIEMAGRTSTGDMVKLPMSRQDIADYLGLRIETVSRALTDLTDRSTIALPNSRFVVLRNRSALKFERDEGRNRRLNLHSSTVGTIGFVLALATSARTMPLAPVQQQDSTAKEQAAL